jgi:1-aminocyclopropane-1-carboxylate deaminase/D-cysteine desulfhydrase-like pyridoxal-dependent ACC family enzyme
MLFDISNAVIETLNDELFLQKQVRLSVLRLDKIHPVVSGNKLFKLYYFLEEAEQSSHKTILSFGGAYSNHLAATAFACRALQLKSIGIVRGEQPAHLSPTLQQCMNDGMQLKFITRQQFAEKENGAFTSSLQNEFGDCIIVPEGGYHPSGANGAALIMDIPECRNYSHICTATGTGTTLAGLLKAAAPSQIIVALPVLKGMTDIEERIAYLTGNKDPFKNLQLLSDYHFGGYAKKTEALIQFMNKCWHQFHLPLDFVYTAKMLFGIIDRIKDGYFPPGSNILCLHTGGLQGNKSLPLHTLLF